MPVIPDQLPEADLCWVRSLAGSGLEVDAVIKANADYLQRQLESGATSEAQVDELRCNEGSEFLLLDRSL